MEVRAEHDPAAVRAVHTAAVKDDGHVCPLSAYEPVFWAHDAIGRRQ
jgi:hypothetical protein